MKKNYANLKRTTKELKIGDRVYLQEKTKRRSLKLINCAKLEPRFCGPFKVLNKIGLVSYRIALLANMRAHNVFHVSLLKRCIHDPNHIIDWNVIQVEPKGEL